MKTAGGFTLIELILYTALSALLVLMLSTINNNITIYASRAQVRSDVERTASFAVEKIQKEIHSASAINIPASIFDVSLGKLTLYSQYGLHNPLIIQVDSISKKLTITKGASIYELTNDTINVDKLIFHNLSTPNGKSLNIRFELKLSRKKLPDLLNSNFSTYATSSAELLNKASYCGDGTVDLSLRENCDEGSLNGTAGHCAITCI
jgi:type II secretory pathway component PulJ